MRMFKILGIFVTALALYACGNETSGKDMEFSKLDNFFIKNDVPLESSGSYFIIRNQEEFSKVFGMARTMGNTIENIDFSKYLVLVVALKSSSQETKVDIYSVKSQDAHLYVHYKIERGKERSYSSTPFMAVKVKKHYCLNISFLEGNTLKKSIPISNKE